MGKNLTQRAQQKIAQRGSAAPDSGEGKAKPPKLAHVITQMQGEIARALPRHMDADRMARVALTAVRKSPKLAQCTPQSFAGALLTASALGMEPGVNDECYLVPYRHWDNDTRQAWMECQLIVGYQGYAKMFYQHPLAAHLDAHVVYERDAFEYRYGTNAYLHHTPARGERGEITDYYAIAHLTSGAAPFVVLSPEAVRELRNGREGPSGDIPDPQRWMERKTCIRQLTKLLPKSTSLAAVLAADERGGTELYRERLAERGDEDLIDLSPTTVTTDAPPGDGPARREEITALIAAMRADALTDESTRLEWARSNIGDPDLATLEHLTSAQAAALTQILTTASKGPQQ
ncbi:recombinase RecT [Nocardia sp. CC201C]|uniref:recombinase RecT n=1 Tax=Nocardia sp. CC201C TaxID=3044575 RepID=UPI0024A7CE5E|nr:recombinase RecT [Nocardia sp. CC201C]